MNELALKGKQTFLGKEIPIIEGGFGENCKVVTAKTVADRALKDGDNILVRELTKVISDQGLTIGQNKLYKILREWDYICKGSTEPTQYAMNRKYFVVETKVINTPYGTKQVFTSYITPLGQVRTVEKIISEYGGLMRSD